MVATELRGEVRDFIGGAWRRPSSDPARRYSIRPRATCSREPRPARRRTWRPLWMPRPQRSPTGGARLRPSASSTCSGSSGSSKRHFDEIARITATENGKTLAEARGEMRRGVENVEVACGIPTLMQGYNLEDVARGIDEIMIRQPLGVVAAITPFNFPAMIPLWFLPYAIACGNTFILKPSERVPLSMMRVRADRADGPAQGCRQSGERRQGRGGCAARSSRRCARSASSAPRRWRATSTRAASANGKRVQCQGGAKNHVVVLPDADMETTTQIVADSAFGCAGQRCLAVSVAVTVGEAREWFHGVDRRGGRVAEGGQRTGRAASRWAR